MVLCCIRIYSLSSPLCLKLCVHLSLCSSESFPWTHPPHSLYYQILVVSCSLHSSCTTVLSHNLRISLLSCNDCIIIFPYLRSLSLAFLHLYYSSYSFILNIVLNSLLLFLFLYIFMIKLLMLFSIHYLLQILYCSYVLKRSLVLKLFLFDLLYLLWLIRFLLLL